MNDAVGARGGSRLIHLCGDQLRAGLSLPGIIAAVARTGRLSNPAVRRDDARRLAGATRASRIGQARMRAPDSEWAGGAIRIAMPRIATSAEKMCATVSGPTTRVFTRRNSSANLKTP